MITNRKSFILLGILLLGVSLWSIASKVIFLSNSAITTGTVVDYELVKLKNGGYADLAFIEFQPSDGITVRFRNSTGSKDDKFNGKVSVIYNPAHPEEARKNDFLEIWIQPISFTCVTLISNIFILTLILSRSIGADPPKRKAPYSFPTPFQPGSTSSTNNTVRLDNPPYNGPSKLDGIDFERKPHAED
jgi:hypothetical protein